MLQVRTDDPFRVQLCLKDLEICPKNIDIVKKKFLQKNKLFCCQSVSGVTKHKIQ